MQVIEDLFKKQIGQVGVISVSGFWRRKEVIDVLTRRSLAICVSLLTFCLAIALFMVAPTKSATDGLTYDPWVDIDDSGNVNIVDITKVARAFGASGDPTKPMVMEAYNAVENLTSFVLNAAENLNITIATAGFRYVSVGIYAQSADSHQFEVFVGQKVAGKYVYTDVLTATSDSIIHVVKPTWYQNIHPSVVLLTYQIAFSELVLSINNISADQLLKGTVAYYLST